MSGAEKLEQLAAANQRYAARLQQVLQDSATARKLFAHWDAVMTPKRLGATFGKVSQGFAKVPQKLAGSLKRLEALEASVAKNPGVAADVKVRREIARLREVIRDGKGPITAALRDTFKQHRRQILKQIFGDKPLVRELDRIDLVLKRRGSGTVQIRVRVKVGAKAESFLLNVDHAGAGFEEAVDAWLHSGNPAHLESILRGDNLQFVEGIENQVALVALRKPGFITPPAGSAPPGVKPPGLHEFGPALAGTAPKVDVDAALAGLGRALSGEERLTIEWVKAQFDTF